MKLCGQSTSKVCYSIYLPTVLKYEGIPEVANGEITSQAGAEVDTGIFSLFLFAGLRPSMSKSLIITLQLF